VLSVTPVNVELQRLITAPRAASGAVLAGFDLSWAPHGGGMGGMGGDF
jgi:hypothetical protein